MGVVTNSSPSIATSRNALMTEAETTAIFKKSSDCLEKSSDEECSLEEVDELLTVLKDTEQQLKDRLEDIAGRCLLGRSPRKGRAQTRRTSIRERHAPRLQQ